MGSGDSQGLRGGGSRAGASRRPRERGSLWSRRTGLAGHKAIAVGCNVADETEVAAIVEQAVSTFGRQRPLRARLLRTELSLVYQAAVRQKAGRITATGMTKESHLRAGRGVH
jgi:NAD(P)-dependent dehydrogenase (short-subunit alcohol dehydrogenase family)